MQNSSESPMDVRANKGIKSGGLIFGIRQAYFFLDILNKTQAQTKTQSIGVNLKFCPKK